MDEAVERPGLIYIGSSESNAVQVKQRCYAFRRRYREVLEDAHPSGGEVFSPYDQLIIRHVLFNPETREVLPKPPGLRVTNTLQFAMQELQGKLFDPEAGMFISPPNDDDEPPRGLV